MLRHKNIDRVCCVILALTLLVTTLFVGAAASGAITEDTAMGYETRLFDQSRVHTIDIVMDNWDTFLETATTEEYAACHLVIDGESYRNVAIRGKGNTSLTSVKSYGNNRYSFKVEFDHYQTGSTYHGLDKLSLNNLIQDNTYMKDYFAYTLMNQMGVAAPLCSFVQINVNGEPWGLYLAVEGVEDSFLQRNYGKNYGELYKPDSMSFGGGRGNGRDFDMDEAAEKFGFSFDGENSEMPTFTMPDMGGSNPFGGEMPDMSSMPQMPAGGEMPDMGNMPQMTDGGEMPDMGNMPQMTAGGEMPDMGNMPQMPAGGEIPDMSNLTQMPPGGEMSDMSNFPQIPTGGENSNADNAADGNKSRIRGGFGGMGSDDVKLVYTDDDPDSYTNIFNNAKTDVTDADKARLIASLKALGKGDTSVVDTDAVIRYMAVHNFLCNDDSYTGTMIHNYYLYEEDGVLSMIPWDYNLAFGGFQGGSNATSLINRDIDSLVNGGGGDRPMADWITASEEYTEQYHAAYQEFMSTVFDSGWFADEIDRVTAMIASYVESDPTAFCTYEEFQTGAATLKDFCLLRAQSVNLQLNGENASVDASDLVISTMGSMGHDKDGMDFPGGMERPDGSSVNRTGKGMGGRSRSTEKPSGNGEAASANATSPAVTVQAAQNPPDFQNLESQRSSRTDQQTPANWLWLTACAVLLAGAMLLVGKYSNKR